MGFFYLIIARLAGIFKVIAVKKCGTVAKGAKNSVKINLIRALGCLAVSLIVFAFSPSGLDTNGLWISLLSGVSNALFLFLWILAAERLSLCLVEVFCMLGSVVLPQLLAPLLYEGETVSWHQWLCTGALVLATFLFFPKSTKKAPFDWKSLLLLTACGLTSAGTVISQKLYGAYSSSNISVFNLTTFAAVCAAFSIAFLFIIIKDKREKKGSEVEKQKFTATVWVLIAIATTMLYANSYLHTLASNHFSSAVFFPLSYSIGWFFTFLSDLIVFKEKATAKKIVGFCIVIVTGVLICL
ncbi:MAG: hypothetical protein IJ373_01960 [Clostridia bacterium]|nr:hypothetical protein [Clostridia bacterium]